MRTIGPYETGLYSLKNNVQLTKQNKKAERADENENKKKMRKVDKFTWEQNFALCNTDSVKWTRDLIVFRKGQRIKAMRCEILIEMTDNKESVQSQTSFLEKKRTSRAEATIILKRNPRRGRKPVCV